MENSNQNYKKYILFFFIALLVSQLLVLTFFWTVDTFVVQKNYMSKVEDVKRNNQNQLLTVDDWEKVLPQYQWTAANFFLYYSICAIYWFILGVTCKQKMFDKWKYFLLLPVIVHYLLGNVIGIFLGMAVFSFGASNQAEPLLTMFRKSWTQK